MKISLTVQCPWRVNEVQATLLFKQAAFLKINVRIKNT